MSTLGLRVATANLRCRVPDVLDDDPDNWRRRLPAMATVLQGLGELGELPLVLTGDFNCSAGSDPWRLALEHGLRDTVEAADRLGTLVDTFHDYAEPCASEPLERIDWVLVSPEWSVDSCEVVTDRPGGVWGSDHWPVVADLHL